MALSPKDFEGPIGDVLERVKRDMQRTMPTAFQGRALNAALVSLDQDRKAVMFSWPDGATAYADGQVVGVFQQEPTNPDNVVWQWGWTNELFRPEVLVHAMKLKEYGESRRVAEIMTPALEGRVERCWAFAMLNAALVGAESVVGVQRNGAMVLMTVGPMRAA